MQLSQKLGAGLILLAATAVVGAARPTLVCSFSIPADWSKALLGEEAQVESLAGPNAELHTYQPTPGDIRRLISADLIIGIDPSLEPWLKEISDSNNLSYKVLWIGTPWVFAGQKREGGQPDTPGEKLDPHVWMDPRLAEAMVNQLADRSRQLPGIDSAALEQRRLSYLRGIRELDQSIASEFAGLAAERKVVVTHHGNLARFAGRYGIHVAGVILRSSSTEAADPSARALADLVETCRAQGVRAVICDRGQHAPAADTLARETGLPPPLELSIDALDEPGTPAGTWLGMMRDNARRLADALRKP